MDPIEEAANRDDGGDPDDPKLLEAIDFVRWELEMLRYRDHMDETSAWHLVLWELEMVRWVAEQDDPPKW
ncbi:hypothetical protein [Rhodococcus marinonascens]|uniref:hypothetical protein n=1 Tax=Rhodococcus marinonascens TaxID=38311 RepID=UPI0009332A76|nr:hypothetical protein [Rhodococcus marinonascens]